MPLQLNLSDDQVTVLTLAIDSYYSDLREEIYHTDDSDVRQTLKDLEQALNGVRAALEPGWQPEPGYPADAGPDLTVLGGQSASDAPPAGQGTPPIGAADRGTAGTP
jgi:hypothetical protein